MDMQNWAPPGYVTTQYAFQQILFSVIPSETRLAAENGEDVEVESSLLSQALQKMLNRLFTGELVAEMAHPAFNSMLPINKHYWASAVNGAQSIQKGLYPLGEHGFNGHVAQLYIRSDGLMALNLGLEAATSGDQLFDWRPNENVDCKSWSTSWPAVKEEALRRLRASGQTAVSGKPLYRAMSAMWNEAGRKGGAPATIEQYFQQMKDD